MSAHLLLLLAEATLVASLVLALFGLRRRFGLAPIYLVVGAFQYLQIVLATAVRYWGGVKLGAGGLVRAYTDCIAQALLTAEKIERVAQVELGCELPYELEGRLRRLAEQHGAVLVDVRHEARVHMRFALPVTARSGFAAYSARRARLDLRDAGIQTLDCIHDRVKLLVCVFIHWSNLLPERNAVTPRYISPIICRDQITVLVWQSS